jgi:spore coat polysaccharide biosynthesis predicted glycosyltransferase SpsG
MELLADADPRVGLHVDTQAMAALIAEADLAIGAGGSSAWERCVPGLPAITLILADNQRENTLALAAAGAAVALEVNGALPARLGEDFRALAADAERRGQMSEAAAALCDGAGAERVAARILAMVARSA